jgi:hypothetical protein
MRRKVGVFLAVGLVLPLLVSASAQAFAGLTLSPSSGHPGDQINATGVNGTYATGTGVNAVSIRLSTRTGQQLTTATPDGSNNFAATFPVPSLAPGTYLILATQTNTNGRQHAFTPGRAKLVVLASRSHGALAGPTGGGSSLPLWALSALPLILVLAVGSRRAGHRRRTPARPRLGN